MRRATTTIGVGAAALLAGGLAQWAACATPAADPCALATLACHGDALDVCAADGAWQRVAACPAASPDGAPWACCPTPAPACLPVALCADQDAGAGNMIDAGAP